MMLRGTQINYMPDNSNVRQWLSLLSLHMAKSCKFISYGKIVNMKSGCGLPAPYRLVGEKERFREVRLSFPAIE